MFNAKTFTLAAGLLVVALGFALPSPAHASVCVSPYRCLCRDGYMELVIYGTVASVGTSEATVKVLEVTQKNPPSGAAGVLPGDSIVVRPYIWGDSLVAGAKVVIPMRMPTGDGGPATDSFDTPMYVDNQDRAVCFTQKNVRVPRKEATEAILIQDKGVLCRKTLHKYGLDPNADTCGGDPDACTMSGPEGASPAWILLPALALLLIRLRRF